MAAPEQRRASKLWQWWAWCCQLLLLVCTLACPLLKPPPHMKTFENTICSTSAGSQPLKDASGGFGATFEDCKAKCLHDEHCNYFSFGEWKKGFSNFKMLPPKWGGRCGEARCQLYVRCVRKDYPEMIVYMMKPGRLSREDLPWLFQMVANVLALVRTRFACVAAVVTAFEWGSQACSPGGLPVLPTATAALHASSLLVLVALEWGNRQRASEEIQIAEEARHSDMARDARMHKSQDVVPPTSVPFWREEECRPPPYKLLSIVMCTSFEAPGLISIAKMPVCQAERSPSGRWLECLTARALRLFERTGAEPCAPQMLVLPLTTLTVAWWCAVLLVVFSPSQSDTMTLPTGGLGIIVLALQMGLAFTYPLQRPITTLVGAAMHCLALILLFHCRAKWASDRKRIVDAESKRATREQDLIALLMDEVQPRYRALVNSSRWNALVDICISVLVLSASAFGVVQMGEDIVRDQGILPALAGFIGFDFPASVRYLLKFGAFALGAPLLSHFFLRMISGMQDVFSSSSQYNANKVKQLAVGTAQWAAQTEREIKRKSGSIADEEYVTVLAPKLRRGSTSSQESLAQNSLGGGEGTLGAARTVQKLKRPEFDAWVEDMAKRALAYRLHEASWNLDESFAHEEETKNKFAEDLRLAATQTSEHIDALFRESGELGGRAAHGLLGSISGFGMFGKLFDFGVYMLPGIVLLIMALMVSLALTPSSTEGLGHSTSSNASTANPACADGAMKFGGAIAIGSAVLFAVPGVGPAGLALVELAGAAGIGGVGGFGHMWNCYMNQ